MPIHTLTKLQYSKDRKGPFALYIYEMNSEYHSRPTWFQDEPKYPEEGEITTERAHAIAKGAFMQGREVRVTDSGDMLVFHAKGKKVLYGEQFWEEILPKNVRAADKTEGS